MLAAHSQRYHQHSISTAGHLHSSPGGQSHDSNFNNQSSLSRSILFKPIDFVSNHRRSASLSGLVRRTSIRRNKPKLIPISASPNPPPQNHANSACQNPDSHNGLFGQAVNSSTAPRTILSSDLDYHGSSSTSHQPNHMTNQTDHPGSVQIHQPNQSARSHMSTLAIIQPRSTWSPSYDVDRRCFQVNLRHPRQQVTSLLALSSIPRPVTPPFDHERENTAGAILLATRAAIEEEAFRAAIAASIETENDRMARHWADHQKPTETGDEL